VSRIVGRYEIDREIGRGGMASVYLARQRDLDRLVALKELRMQTSGDPAFAQRFLREARLGGSLSHPNIVTVHEYFEWNRVPYIAMEYLPHGSLRPYVGGLTLSQIGGVLEGVLAGLGHAEAHRIVHRDIKPENLLLTGEGRVKIADFGIAKPTSSAATAGLVTGVGLTVGTPNYIAPEQAMARTLGPWTDLYSVGITAFELLVGRTPFADTTEPMAVVMRQVNEPIPSLRTVAPQIDGWIADWVAWLVSKAPAERPQSAGEAWEALEEALIAVLGPRWRRETHLQQRGGRTTATLRRPSRRATAPRGAATVPPQRALASTTPAPAPRRSRHVGRSLAAASLVAVSIAVVKFGVTALHGGGAGVAATPTLAQQAVQPAPAPPTTTATQTSTLAAQVAPAQALVQAYERAAKAAAKGRGANADVAAVLNDIARSYRTAADAAAHDDPAGYSAAIATAEARRTTAPASVPPVTVAQPPAQRAASTVPAPRATQTTQTTPYVQPTASSADSSCAGDSSSDDPSDDSCSGP
jgi:hypothetical protein